MIWAAWHHDPLAIVDCLLVVSYMLILVAVVVGWRRTR